MSKDIFKEELTAFFKRYAKRKLKLVDRIVNTFSGNEVEVFNHLHKKYANGAAYDGFFLKKIEEKSVSESVVQETVVENENSEVEEEVSEEREKED